MNIKFIFILSINTMSIASLLSKIKPNIIPACSFSSLLPKFSEYQPCRINTQKEYSDHKPWGMLTSIDVYDCNPRLIRSQKAIRSFLDELCDSIRMKKYGEAQIINFGSNKEVEGYSFLQFIETSSITGHLANKTNNAYIDIFSCSHYDPKAAARFAASFFQGREYRYNVILRK